MNDTELDATLETWKAPAPSPELRQRVKQGIPPGPRNRSWRWVAAAASVVATTSLLGVAMLGRGEAQLADGTRIQSSVLVQPAEARERWHKFSHGLSTGGNRQQSFWYDQATHTYSGYDLTVQPMGRGKYLLTVGPLSTPLRQLSSDADAAQYRETPLPSMPAAKVVGEGEPFDIDLVHDAQTGDRVFERVELSHSSLHSFFEGFAETVHRRHERFAIWLMSLFANDDQLRLNSPRLYINGTLAAASGSSVAGLGVYFYLPDRGRYVMKLKSAGGHFQQAGTVDGSTLEFQLEGSAYRIVSQEPIASGRRRPVYVFHEEAFRVNPEIPELNRPHFGAGNPDPEQ